MGSELVVANANRLVGASGYSVPQVLHAAGEQAAKAFFTFFTDQIRNPNTRETYLRNATAFFAWCHAQRLNVPAIESFHVAAYIELLGQQKAQSTVKQHLARLKMLFDWFVPAPPLHHLRRPGEARVVRSDPGLGRTAGLLPHRDHAPAQVQ